MEHFVARQPIFDRNLKVVAYELLFRSGLENMFCETNGDQATSQVIVNSFLIFGIDEIAAGARAFINFTHNLIVNESALVLPHQSIVVEILESVEPDEAVINACKKLKNAGYTLALDDFVYAPQFEPLVELADIVKVDFLVSNPEEREKMAGFFLSRGIQPLAEKVETHEDFLRALHQGYAFFQGYFFSKPLILSRKDVPAFKLQYLRLLAQINTIEPDFRNLARTVESDVTITYKLLKYINSAAFGLRQKVASVEHALHLLGEEEVRKWASLLTMTNMASDKPAELVVESLIRARFCELAATLARMEDRKSELFMVGLLSQLDAIVDRPLGELLEKINLTADVQDALLNNSGPLRPVFELSVALERGDWDGLSRLVKNIGLDETKLSEIHAQAVKWPIDVLGM
jgi:c-di-GMP-related signal transduction protein